MIFDFFFFFFVRMRVCSHLDLHGTSFVVTLFNTNSCSWRGYLKHRLILETTFTHGHVTFK